MPQCGKALCIGINYTGTQAELRGAANDALNFVEILKQRFGFQRGRVLALIDEYPSGEAVSDGDAGECRRPTKDRMLAALAWLVLDAAPGDTLFFSFSGHAVQVPDTCAGASATLEEALCPEDWDEFEWGVVPHRLISLDLLQQHFAQLPGGVLLTVVLDTSLVGAPLQLPFRIDDRYPSREAENSEAAQGHHSWARPDCAAWLRARHLNALPRRLPFEVARPLWSRLAEWCLKDATPPLDEGVAVFCFTACRGAQVAIEASLEGAAQGCLCFCLLQALEALGPGRSYLELGEAAGQAARRLRADLLPHADQFFQLSYGKNAAPDECAVLDSGSAFAAKDRARRRRGQWQRASLR